MTRSCTARARSWRGCRATPGRSSPTCAPITASCGAIPARSCCSWARSSARAREWNFEQGLDWHLLEVGWHKGVQLLVKDLNRVYRDLPALHQRDCDGERLRLGRWPTTPSQSVFAWLRHGEPGTPPVLVVVQLHAGAARTATASACRIPGRWRERLNTDAALYGGSGMGNLGGVEATAEPWHGHPASADADLAAAGDAVLRRPTADSPSTGSTTIREEPTCRRSPPSRRPVAQRHGLRAGRRPRLPPVRADRPAGQARGLFRRQGRGSSTSRCPTR